MKTLIRNHSYVSSIRGKSILPKSFFTIIFCCIFFPFKLISQCPATSKPTTQINCSSSSVTLGTSTDAGVKYTWYVNGAISHGPLNGDGTSISFSYPINSTANAGKYAILVDAPGAPLYCLQYFNVIYLTDVTGLTTTAITANSVSFTWASQGAGAIYTYIVSPNSIPPYYGGTETTSNSISVNGLSGSSTYYIHVRATCSSNWTTIQFNTLTGPCYAFPADLTGGGNYCSGSTVLLPVDLTLANQKYTWLKNGVGVNGPFDGNGSTLNYSFPISTLAQAGNYTISTTRTGCTSNTFGNVTVSLLSLVTGLTTSVAANSVYFQWNPVAQSTNSNSYYQYFISTSATPPASGTYIYGTAGSSTTTTSGATLINGSTYFIHVRAECKSSTNGYGPWTTSSFIPAAVPAPDCNGFGLTTLCPQVPVIANIGIGSGGWNFPGTYPNNSVGSPTDGKELGYKFTPGTTGVYYLDITNVTGGGIGYFYKPVTAGCTNTGWTGINAIYQPGKYSIGMLQAGIQYFILLDKMNTSAGSQTFKICKASVLSPFEKNKCIPTYYTLSFTIAANSTKEEFILDTTGNLVASLDFSNFNPGFVSVTASYLVNNGMVRHDNNNKEYLDRSFTLNTSFAPSTPLGVKIFFTNDELQRLIDEPNDGIADVTGISDLNITRTGDYCGDEIGFGSLFTPTSNGTYDATSGFIKFTNGGSSTYYIHGGLALLDAGDKINCPGLTTSFVIPDVGPGYTYQWQVDPGTGFVNITNNTIYSGSTTKALNFLTPPSSLYGYKYRCIATNGSNTITSSSKKLKFSVTWNGGTSSAWQNPANWNCGVFPDANTDVIIPAGVPNTPVVSSNVSCKSVTASQGSSVIVATGFKLDITGK